MNFDEEVKVGEIRVFADAKEPLLAAIVGSRGLSGWRIVPVSPYREPVNENELKIGERVFQIWNACTAAKNFVARSWVVDTLSEADLARLAVPSDCVRQTVPSAPTRTALHNMHLGDYERRTLAVGGDFAGWQAKFPAKRKWVWPTASWAAAAMVLVSVGVFYLLPQGTEESVPTERVMTIRMEKPSPEIVVAQCAMDEDPDRAPVSASAEIDLQVEKNELPRCAPAPKVRKLAAAPKMAILAEGRIEAKKSKAVAARGRAIGMFDERIDQTLSELKYKQKANGSWGKTPVKDTALAVLAMMANGATVDSLEYGQAIKNGVRYLTEADLKGLPRQDVQIVACALCCATELIRNPNVRTAAEKALASIDDRRSVEAGRDWHGILVDLTRPTGNVSGSNVAAEPPEKDEIAEASVYVLQMVLVGQEF